MTPPSKLNPYEAIPKMSKLNGPFRVLGLMSGTSLDGLDMTLSQFVRGKRDGVWSGDLREFKGVGFSDEWKKELMNLSNSSAEEWHRVARDWTLWCAEEVVKSGWLEEVDLVVFHGQTVFHRPDEGWTGQLASGSHMYAALGSETPVVCDLRSLDVAMGGQGAPLVPLADRHLYGAHETCLNLGGFANVSYENGDSGERLAYDLGVCNLLFNAIAAKEGLAMDEGGRIAGAGEVIPELLELWLQLPYHRQEPPKSIGREWFEAEVLTKMELFPEASTVDLMATAGHYVASTIRSSVQGKTVFVTGGGAYNTHLIQLLESQNPSLVGSACEVVVPENRHVEGKEAHAFGFLGLLRVLGEDNALTSVTGASKPSSGGALWGFPHFLSR